MKKSVFILYAGASIASFFYSSTGISILILDCLVYIALCSLMHRVDIVRHGYLGATISNPPSRVHSRLYPQSSHPERPILEPTQCQNNPRRLHLAISIPTIRQEPVSHLRRHNPRLALIHPLRSENSRLYPRPRNRHVRLLLNPRPANMQRLCTKPTGSCLRSVRPSSVIRIACGAVDSRWRRAASGFWARLSCAVAERWSIGSVYMSSRKGRKERLSMKISGRGAGGETIVKGTTE